MTHSEWLIERIKAVLVAACDLPADWHQADEFVEDLDHLVSEREDHIAEEVDRFARANILIDNRPNQLK